jgi:hypothetical protein
MNISMETLHILLQEVYDIDDKEDKSTEYIIQHLVDTVFEFNMATSVDGAHQIVMDFLESISDVK